MPKNIFPRQDIPDFQKNSEWYKEHLDFAEYLISQGSYVVEKANRHYDSYNGKSEADSIKYLVSTYGRKNRSKYISYRLSKTKLDILIGEFLKMPLNATIKTINSEAVTAKMQKYEMMLGAMHAKPVIEKYRQLGVDVLEGMDIPDKDDPSAFSKLSFKDKNEAVMQIILKNLIEELGVHEKLSVNVQDCTICSRAYGQIVVNDLTGEMDYEAIDPRDRICMEFDRDPYLEKSPIMGRVQRVPINKILTMYRLTDEQRRKLEDIRTNPNLYLHDAQYRQRYSYQNGEFCADVIHIEWKSLRPKYTKVTPRTNRQMMFDESVTEHRTDMSSKEYEGNQKEYDEKIKKGEVKEIITEWEEDMYEATRIGHDIDINCRRKPFIMKDEDTGKILGFSYVGMVFNKVDGEAISLKEICENFDNVFDVIMYQLLKEINKAKGKVIVYDRAGLPKKTTVKNVLYNALNDSFIDYDSSAAGNMSGKDLSINNVFKEIDLGVSSSFQYLVQFKQDIQQTLDSITGIQQERQGNIAASATVTNSMQSIEASRTITEPMFYALTKFAERVMLNMVETGKLVLGLYQPNKARMLLGDEKYNFMQATMDIAFQAYRVSLVNPRWEQSIRDRMRQMAEYSLNAKELRPQDLLEFELSETLADAKSMLKKAWSEINNMRMAEAEKKIQADSENVQKQIEGQREIMKEDREDKQNAKKDEILLKGKVDMQKEVVKQKGQMILDQNSFDNEEQSPQ